MTSSQLLSDVPASASPDCDSSDEEEPVVESTLHSQLPIPDLSSPDHEQVHSEPDQATPSNVESVVQPNVSIGKTLKFVSRVPDFDGRQISAVVKSRGGKATGKYSDWWNVIYQSPQELAGQTDCVDVSALDQLECCSTDADQSFIITVDEYKDAKLDELANWKSKAVYEEVDDVGQPFVTCRWVQTEKPDRKKARLVVRGFEDPNLDQVVKDSPTCAKGTLRVVIWFCSYMQWMCNTMDMRTAFLQGSDLRRDVFIKPPAGFATVGVLWKLKKCIYGLVDAARHWYDRVKSELLDVGCIVSMYDPCLFYKKDSRGNVYGLIATHVDDFLWAGNASFKCEVIDKLNEVFDVRSSQKTPFTYLGFEISQKDNCIRLDLSAYLSDVKEVSVDFLSADKFHMRDLRALLGQLQWIACQVRPDIAFAVSSLLSFAGQWQRCHFLAANKIVRKLKFSSDLCLIYQKVGILSEHCSIDVFTDASFGNLPCGGTQAGYLVFINQPGCKPALLSWRSQKLRRVVRSTLFAETVACCNGIEAALVCHKLVLELTTQRLRVNAYTDSRSLVENVYSTKKQKDKGLRVEIPSLRSLIDVGSVNRLYWVPSDKEVADCSTKLSARASDNLIKFLTIPYVPVTLG